MNEHTPNTRWRNSLLTFAVICGLFCLSGCGQKGPLVLPKVAQHIQQG